METHATGFTKFWGRFFIANFPMISQGKRKCFSKMGLRCLMCCVHAISMQARMRRSGIRRQMIFQRYLTRRKYIWCLQTEKRLMNYIKGIAFPSQGGSVFACRPQARQTRLQIWTSCLRHGRKYWIIYRKRQEFGVMGKDILPAGHKKWPDHRTIDKWRLTHCANDTVMEE